jgi:hypothetical protein
VRKGKLFLGCNNKWSNKFCEIQAIYYRELELDKISDAPGRWPLYASLSATKTLLTPLIFETSLTTYTEWWKHIGIELFLQDIDYEI